MKVCIVVEKIFENGKFGAVFVWEGGGSECKSPENHKVCPPYPKELPLPSKYPCRFNLVSRA